MGLPERASSGALSQGRLLARLLSIRRMGLYCPSTQKVRSKYHEETAWEQSLAGTVGDLRPGESLTDEELDEATHYSVWTEVRAWVLLGSDQTFVRVAAQYKHT